MKHHLPALALLASLATGATAQEVVRLGTEGAYPPWNFINERNEVDGFERHLGDALCERAGLTCEWVVNDWDSIIPNLVGGNYDVIIAGMSVTAAREEVIDFSEWYLPPDPSAFFALAGTDASVTETGVIGTQSNTIFADYLAGTEATLVEFSTPEDMVAAVRSGVVDAVLFDSAYVDPIVAESAGVLEQIGERLFLSSGIALGLRKSDAELRETLNEAIIGMKADGSLNELITQWFGDSFPLFE